MGYYCTVPQCTSLAGKTKNVKFHRFPRDETLANKWNEILHRHKPFTKYSKVCSLHFTQADYNITTMGQWKTLSKDAIPTQNLPKLNADGSVMVIRKTRQIKVKNVQPFTVKAEKSDYANTSASSYASSPGSSSLNSTVNSTLNSTVNSTLNSTNMAVLSGDKTPAMIPQISGLMKPMMDQGDVGLRSISEAANFLPKMSLPHAECVRPQRHDANMQTDPLDASEHTPQQETPADTHAEQKQYNDHKQYAEHKSFSDQKEYQNNCEQKHYAEQSPGQPDHEQFPEQKYLEQVDYRSTGEAKNYTREELQTDDFNKEAEKYALERGRKRSYEKSPSNYPPDPVENYNKQPYKQTIANTSPYKPIEYAKLPEYERPYDGYKQEYFHNPVETLRNQQHNIQMLQGNHDNFYVGRIKEEVDLNDDKYTRYENMPVENSYDSILLLQQQKLITNFYERRPSIKTEPEAQVDMQPGYYREQQPAATSGSSVAYYTQHREEAGSQQQMLSRQPGAEMLIAKQNALAAISNAAMWQNSMKRPFYYSDNPHAQFNGGGLHGRYDDTSRVMNL